MLHLTSAEIASWLGILFWPFLRVGGTMAVAPVFGSHMVPVRIRLVLALAVTWVLVPMIPTPPPMGALSPAAVMTAAQQVLIGVAMGFMLQLVFGAVVIGGQCAALSMGLGFASMVDPQNGVQVPVVSQFLLILATLVFLALNGHLVLIQVLADSFRILPVAPLGLSSDALWLLVGWGTHMFAGSVLIALPAVTALMVVNVSLGVMTRAAPTLNLFTIGFPLSMLVGFFMLVATLPSLLPHLTDLLAGGFETIQALLRGG